MTPAIVSVSRRTDVPAFHADWFFRCLEQGWAMAQGPGGSRFVSLAQRDVAGFVFWTKNPAPMLDRLDQLGDVPFYFQFTLTSYGRDVEPGIPPKGEVLVPLFRQLSRQVGRRRVVWRDDPVFFSPVYTLDYHRRWFDRLAGLLGPYTDTCTVSFLDWYPVMERNMTQLGAQHETSARGHGLFCRLCQARGYSAGDLRSGRRFFRSGRDARRLRGPGPAGAAPRGARPKPAPSVPVRPQRGHRLLRQLPGRLPVLLRRPRGILNEKRRFHERRTAFGNF